jgi:hypothetical protein
VVGRKYNDHAATDKDRASCRRIFVRGLTPETHGNAAGIGLAEFTNQRTIDSVDRKITNINCLTGQHPTGGMLPIAFDTDREVVEAALLTCGLTEPHQCRVIQIADTLHLAECLVSDAYLPRMKERPDLEALEEPREMAFDAWGNLFPVTAGSHGGH